MATRLSSEFSIEFDDLVFCQVGRGHQGETGLTESSDSQLHQGQLEQHRLVFEEVEPVSGDTGTRLKVDQVVCLGNRHVVPGFEVEFGHVAPSSQLDVAVVAQCDRGVGMCHVGDARLTGTQIGFDLGQLTIQSLQLLTQLPTAGDQGLLGLVALGRGDLRGGCFLLAPQFVAGSDQLTTTSPEGDDPV